MHRQSSETLRHNLTSKPCSTKKNVLEYLEDVCAGANLAAADMRARQLFLLGEGLIVTMQVMGHTQVDADAALAAWHQLTCR